jgi:hypothetical protein
VSADRMIRRAVSTIALWMTVALPALSQEAASGAKATTSTKSIAALAWLVGGVWTADASSPSGAKTRIETRYQWADNSAYVRFTTHFVSDKGTLKNYDGSFFWNPEQSSLAMWYTDAAGEITQGPVTVTADTMLMSFRASDFDGKIADMRVTVTRKNSDWYTWRLEERQSNAWKPLLPLEYRRNPGM